MSEKTVDCFAYFTDQKALTAVAELLSNVSKTDEVPRCLDVPPFRGYPQNGWAIESCSVAGNVLALRIGAHSSSPFSPQAILGFLSDRGAQIGYADTLSESLNRSTVGRMNGSKCSAKAAKNALIEKDPTFALRYGKLDRDQMISLLESGANPNVVVDRYPLVILAIDSRNTPLLEALIAKGVNLNVYDFCFGDTALAWAIRNARAPAFLEQLLAAGADPNVRGKGGERSVWNMLQFTTDAPLAKLQEALSVLLRYGLRMDPERDSSQIVHFIPVIRDRLIDANTPSARNKTLNQGKAILEGLLSAGDQFAYLDNANEDALQLAAAAPDLVAVLESLGARSSAKAAKPQDLSRFTPIDRLSLAIKNANDDYVIEFINRRSIGAYTDCDDPTVNELTNRSSHESFTAEERGTLLEMAVRARRGDLVAKLTEWGCYPARFLVQTKKTNLRVRLHEFARQQGLTDIAAYLQREAGDFEQFEQQIQLDVLASLQRIQSAAQAALDSDKCEPFARCTLPSVARLVPDGSRDSQLRQELKRFATWIVSYEGRLSELYQFGEVLDRRTVTIKLLYESYSGTGGKFRDVTMRRNDDEHFVFALCRELLSIIY